MNAQVNRGNTHSSTDSRKRYIRFERYSRAHWRRKNFQFVLGGYSGHHTSIIGRYVLSGVRVNRSLVYMYVLSIVVCPFVLFLLAIVLSALLLYTVSDCPFSISKLFFDYFEIEITNFTHSIRKIIDTSTLMEPVADMFIKYKGRILQNDLQVNVFLVCEVTLIPLSSRMPNK
jgi:hypothetical protein